MMLNMESLADVIVRLKQEFKQKTIVSCMMAVAEMGAALKMLDENNIPQYSFPESATRSIIAMQAYKRWITRPRTGIRVFDVNDTKDNIRRLFTEVKGQGRNYVHESEAMEVLRAYGIQTPQTRVASVNEDECVKLSEEVGYPVVLKISSPHIVHKVDVGGVELNLKNSHEVRAAFQRIIRNVKNAKSDARIAGFHIEEFIKAGKEVIIGMKRDPQFGPLIMFGSGGIYVEVFKDVCFRLAPIKKLSARNMIESTKANKLLLGVRGEKASDVDSVVECLERVTQLVIDFPEIQELDINPLLVFEQGNGYRAVDARLVIS